MIFFCDNNTLADNGTHSKLLSNLTFNAKKNLGLLISLVHFLSPAGEAYATLTDDNGVYTGCFFYNPLSGISTYRIINKRTGDLRVIETLSKPMVRETSKDGSAVDYSRRKVVSDTAAVNKTAFVIRHTTTSDGVAPPKNSSCIDDDYEFNYTAMFDFIDCYSEKESMPSDFPNQVPEGSVPVETCGIIGIEGPMYMGLAPAVAPVADPTLLPPVLAPGMLPMTPVPAPLDPFAPVPAPDMSLLAPVPAPEVFAPMVDEPPVVVLPPVVAPPVTTAASAGQSIKMGLGAVLSGLLAFYLVI